MIYVDELVTHPSEAIQPAARRWGNRWCHMWVNPGDEEELHGMADVLGLKRDWFQDKPNFPHYDLLPRKRELATKLGAKPTNLRQWIKERNALNRDGGSATT